MAFIRTGSLGIATIAVAGIAAASAVTFFGSSPQTDRPDTVSVVSGPQISGVSSSATADSTPASADYYVDCSASSNGSGTSSSSPWNTLSSVNTKSGGFAPGDRILFKRDSTCTGQLAPKGSGALGSPIVISEYSTGAAKPLIQGQGAVEDTVLLTNQQYWEITNLRVTNKPAGDNPTRGLYRGIHVTNTGGTRLAHIYIKANEVFNIWTKSGEDAGTNLGLYKAWAGIRVSTDDSAGSSYDDVVIEGNVVHESGGVGIATAGELTSTTTDYFTNVVVRQNEVYNGRVDGIIVRSSLAPLIEYNYVHNNGAGGTGFGTVGLWVRSTSGAVVQYNEVSYHGQTGGDGQAFDADINAKDTVFQYNYSHNNHGGFLLVYDRALTGTIARYNISIDDAVYRAFLDLNAVASIYNNTFVQRGSTNTKPLLENNIAATQLYNNIFWRQNAPATTYNSIGDARADFRNNVFYYASGSHPSDEPTGNGNATGDPLFVTAPTAAVNGRANVSGYRLSPGSSALGSGTLVSGNGGKDYFGNVVSASSNPNKGFYQGSGVSTTSPLTMMPVADAYVQDGTGSTTNYGGATTLAVKGGAAAGYRRKSLLRFDLSSLGSVSSAKLRIYGRNFQDNTAVTLSAFSLADDTWNETTVTWNTAPARGTPALGTVVVNGTAQYYEIDVTAFVQGQLSDDLAGFVLEDVQFLDKGLTFNSREAGTNQPQLVVTP